MEIKLLTTDNTRLTAQVIKQEQFSVNGQIHVVHLASYKNNFNDTKYVVIENKHGEFYHQRFSQLMLAKSCYEYRCDALADKILHELYLETDFSLLSPNP